MAWLPDAYDDVTVRDLLQHTSGVPRDLRTDNLDDFDAEAFRARLGRAQPAFARGARYEYSNTGYILLGLVVEQATGRPFDVVLNQTLVEPLGLTSTVYLEAPTDDPLHAEGTEPGEACFARAPYYSGGFSAGGVTSSIHDLALWLDALDDPDFLPAWAHHLMHSPGDLADGQPARLRFGGDPEARYGMGWFLTRRGERVLWTHGGAVSGFSSTIDRYPEDDLAVIVLTNSKGPGAQVVAQRLADLLLEQH
jgi:CubicO group peptidase (beta-lactamase class C family)